MEPPPVSVSVTQRYTVPQGEEPGVVISTRDYERLIERLEGCRPGGWGELWLAGVGGGLAVAAATAVGALTLPPALTGIIDVLWAVTVAGCVITTLCLVGYLSQRRDNGREIDELRKDLEMHKPRTDGQLPRPMHYTGPPVTLIRPCACSTPRRQSNHNPLRLDPPPSTTAPGPHRTGHRAGRQANAHNSALALVIDPLAG
jgi:hypothetical protein